MRGFSKPSIVIIMIIVGLSGCVFQDQGFFIKKLTEPPDNYINISYDRLRRFRTLKNAILNYDERVSISVPIQEFYMVQGIITLHDTNYILYNNSFYEIGLYHAD